MPSGGSGASGKYADLEIREAPNGQVYVKDLALVPVRNISEVLDVVNLGVSLRATFETKLNMASSRSHTVFTVHVVQKDRANPDSDVISGVINFVDLAGSERLARSKSEGQRFREAVIINSSLSALGKVVLALASDPRTVRYIPYRDSKLTRILQSSLGGNSYTTLLTTIDPSSDNYDESLNSLAFADRCRNVQNRPTVNYVDSGQTSSEKRVKRLVQEIAQLKQQLELSRVSFEQKVNYMAEELGADSHTQKEAQVSAAAKEEEKFKDGLDRAKSEVKKRLHQERARTEQHLKAKKGALEDHFSQVQEAGMRKNLLQQDKIVLRERNKLLMAQTKKTEQHAEHVKATLAQEHKEALERNMIHAAEIVAEKEALVKQMPHVLRHGRDAIVTEKRKYVERQEAELDLKHENHLQSLMNSHEEEVENVEKQYRYWLMKKEEESRKFVRDFDDYHLRKRAEIHRYGSELLSLNELLGQLRRMVEDMCTGKFPASHKTGIRAIVAPAGLPRRGQKTEGPAMKAALEKMLLSLTGVKQKAASYERLMRRRALMRDTGEDGTQEGTRGSGAEDGESGEGGMLNMSAFARDFCGTPEEDEAGVLRYLTEEQLVGLATALRRRARLDPQVLDQAAERKALREEAMRDLSGHSTIERLRSLEAEVEKYKGAILEEQSRSRKLRVALDSARRLNTESRPTSAAP